MENNEPPLVQCYSNPKKIRLVHPDGVALGACLYKVRGLSARRRA
jgi:hypothetical protein